MRDAKINVKLNTQSKLKKGAGGVTSLYKNPQHSPSEGGRHFASDIRGTGEKTSLATQQFIQHVSQ